MLKKLVDQEDATRKERELKSINATEERGEDDGGEVILAKQETTKNDVLQVVDSCNK